MANNAMVGWAWGLAVLALLQAFLPFVFKSLFTEPIYMLIHFIVVGLLFGAFVYNFTEYNKSKDKKV